MRSDNGAAEARADERVARRRDYSLLGADGRAAVDAGLVGASWYCPPISRKRLAELMKRRDGPAIRDTLIWFSALLLSGGAGIVMWGSWWAALPFAVYGVLYGSVGDSRWHECGHGTAFKTRWMNEAVHQLASFMMLREPTIWRYSHRRHHTDTIIVGRDPEIASFRPPDLPAMALNLFALKSGIVALAHVMSHSIGRMTPEEESFVPQSARSEVRRTARIWLSILVAILAACVMTRSVLPALLVGLPTFYGGWLTPIFGWTQHAGLAEDVLDHRLNSRTVYMNPVSRFLYWNMNYHLDHHMFPMVPYHALPKLHELLRPYCPAPYPGLAAAYREIISAWLRQISDPGYGVVRSLPPPLQSRPCSDGKPNLRE
jgi:fatty acid desaturase